VGDLDISGAAKVLAVDLGSQVGAGTTERIVVVDPVLDRVTGQQTVLSAQLDSAITSAIATSVKGAKVLPFNAESAKNARFVLTASVAPTDSANRYTVSASLTDQPTGLIVAQSAARFVMSNADRSPTRFYNDSPSLVRDRSVEGYLRTSELKKGSPADALYVSQIPTSGLLAQATAAYDAGRWEEALTAYEAASARSDGQQLRTFNGLYLSNIRLNRTAAATAAFGKIAALGLATDNLAVKLLFKPGSSSDWWPDFAGVYPMWVRQIARAAQQTKSCLEVVGHTSRSGTEAVNNKLSVARAETVRRMMLAEANTLARRLRASGVGFRENIVGTGADNASDAIDRRVEFKIEACQP
jgi:outer membrane protein OmpA-like peptidoglycan-associated protein